MRNLSAIKLLSRKRFLPLFVTQALEAFNDNAIRSVLIILATYQTSLQAGSSIIVANLSAIAYTIPFIILSPLAGQLSEKFHKPTLIRWIKLIEVVCMALAGWAVWHTNLGLLLFCVLIMGVHSALFGPIKYAILPELLKKEELLTGNAWVEASTFVMILLGYMFGVYLIGLSSGRALTAFLMFATAITGLVYSFFIPQDLSAQQPELKINYNIIKQTKSMITQAKTDPKLWSSIILIAWFWYYGITLQTLFSSYSKYSLHLDSDGVGMLMAVMALGVSAGAFFARKILSNGDRSRHTPLALLGLSVFTIIFFFSSPTYDSHVKILQTVSSFLQSAQHIFLLTQLLLMSACAGYFVLPLYVTLQESAAEYRSRIIACNNIISAVVMFMAAIAAIIFSSLYLSAAQIFFITALLNLVAMVYSLRLLPKALLFSIFKWVTKVIYKVKIKGLDNYTAAGDKVIIVANHSSFLDVPLLSCYLPDQLCFVINSHVAQQGWVKPFLRFTKTFVVDSENAMSLKEVINKAAESSPLVIFPEGRITTTGSLMKVYQGPAMIADKTDATILPIRIDGTQFTRFSRTKNFFKRKIPEITINICPPCKLDISKQLTGRERREKLTSRLHDIMTQMVFDSSEKNNTIFYELLNARKLYGGKLTVLEDAEYKQLNYSKLITKSYAIGNVIAKSTKENQVVGVMMATSLATTVLFFAAQAYCRVPAMINFSAGFNAIYNSCLTAEIKIIYTARKFIEIAKLENIVKKLEEKSIKIIYLEDMAESLSSFAKIKALVHSKCDFIYQSRYSAVSPHKQAVILFTSGSEGVPKGVSLSHYNINSNCYQVQAAVDVSMTDVVLNTLPMFHCFGLTMGMLLPVFNGIKSVLYPSPLHYRIIPEMIYDRNITILFSTNTFLQGYARYAHPYDFYSMRYIFAGAEPLRETTREVYMKKFGIRLLEGYGVTETTPVAAVNTAMYFKAGTVGRILPGMKTKIEPVPGIDKGGRLLLKGANVMLGYLKLDQPGVLQPVGEWYDTGDIVDIDKQGFIKILGRAKRFAKLAGEMVSLQAVEKIILDIWPDNLHAVISIPSERSGEQLLLITESEECNSSDIISYVNKHNYPERMIPKKIKYVKELPILSSGKVDYVTLQKEYQPEGD